MRNLSNYGANFLIAGRNSQGCNFPVAGNPACLPLPFDFSLELTSGSILASGHADFPPQDEGIPGLGIASMAATDAGSDLQGTLITITDPILLHELKGAGFTRGLFRSLWDGIHVSSNSINGHGYHLNVFGKMEVAFDCQ